MKFLAYKISRIRNQIEKISKIVNISPNKTHYGVIEFIQELFRIFIRTKKQFCSKSGYFINFL